MGFDKMEPIFGQLKAERSGVDGQHEMTPVPPSLFLVGVLPNDPSTLRFLLSDFHSNSWEAQKSKAQLEDMRDIIGIGGSWSDFVEYVIASIKSEDAKLVIEGQSKTGGAACAKFVAQKAKGMPRISISLEKLVGAAANNAMADLSLELFKAYKNMHNLLINEENRRCQLTKILSVEQEKNETLQKQLDTVVYAKKQKLQKVNDKATSDGSVLPSQDSPDKQVIQNPATSKASHRVVPAYRRAKVRGVLLQDTEDDLQD